MTKAGKSRFFNRESRAMDSHGKDILFNVRELLEPLLASKNLELFDIEFKGQGKKGVLRVYIDKEEGVTIDDCALVSRELGTLLDIHDMIPNSYTLEVSSPGLTRALRRPEDYIRFKGRKVKIKTTVVTGFLGAGKTTFINNLIKKYPRSRFALVENEFGDVAIDTQLIQGMDAGKMFELKNGCICCTISNEYELILLELAGRYPDIGHLIIETTGIADPVPVISPFFRDREIRKQFEYNGTVCVVDAVNYNRHIFEGISVKQVATADLVLINKSEQISNTRKGDLQKEILEANPLGECRFAVYGNTEEFELLSLLKLNVSQILQSVTEHTHEGIDAKTLIIPFPPGKEKFMDWISYNLDCYKKDIYRVKGILYFKDDPFRYFLQAVGGSFELHQGGVYLHEEESKIIFIGKLKGVVLKF